MTRPKAGKARSLGINTKLQSPLTYPLGGVTYKTINAAREAGMSPDVLAVLYQALKWRRLNDVQLLFPLKDNYSNEQGKPKVKRVAKCHKVRVAPYVEIKYSDKYKRAGYGGGLMKCGARWVCPVCSARIGEQDRAELESINFLKLGYGVIMATYTLSHHIDDKCADVMYWVKSAHMGLKAGKAYQTFKARWGVKGSITVLEITFNYRNGWHIHIHELIVYSLTAGSPDTESVKLELFKLYQRQLNKIGATASWEHGLDIVAGDNASVIAAYIAKFGYEPKDKAWTVQAEAVKGSAKLGRGDSHTAMQLLDLWAMGDKRAAAKFIEYEQATKGRHVIGYSNGLRKLLKLGVELTDEQKARSDDPMSHTLALLSGENWRDVLKLGKRAHVIIEYARDGDTAKFIERMARIGIVVNDIGPWKEREAKARAMGWQGEAKRQRARHK